jgi:subtilisin family serine protease
MMHSSTWITPQEARKAIEAGSGRGIKIALIDSGVELSHPMLRNFRLVDDIAFELSDSGVVSRTPGRGIDNAGHGTGIVTVIRRVAPEAEIGSFRVLDNNQASKFQIIQEAARLAIDRGYHILNCSIGSRASLDRMDVIAHFKPWVDTAYRRGVHIVSACNNSHFRDPEWPGYFPSVITVNMARTDCNNLFFRWDVQEGEYSQHLVEFAARGVDVRIGWKNGTEKNGTGSSYAAPHAAGLLARLLSVYPRLKPPVAKALLQEVALPWTPTLAGPNG